MVNKWFRALPGDLSPNLTPADARGGLVDKYFVYLCSFLWLLGVKVIFRVGLVLLKCMLGSQEKLRACQGQYETMERLRAVEPRYMQESFLIKEVQHIRSRTHTFMQC